MCAVLRGDTSFVSMQKDTELDRDEVMSMGNITKITTNLESYNLANDMKTTLTQTHAVFE